MLKAHHLQRQMKSPQANGRSLQMAETKTNEKELADFVLHTATFEQRQAIKAGEKAKEEIQQLQEAAQAAADEIKKRK